MLGDDLGLDGLDVTGELGEVVLHPLDADACELGLEGLLSRSSAGGGLAAHDVRHARDLIEQLHQFATVVPEHLKRVDDHVERHPVNDPGKTTLLLESRETVDGDEVVGQRLGEQTPDCVIALVVDPTHRNRPLQQGDARADRIHFIVDVLGDDEVSPGDELGGRGIRHERTRAGEEPLQTQRIVLLVEDEGIALDPPVDLAVLLVPDFPDIGASPRVLLQPVLVLGVGEVRP